MKTQRKFATIFLTIFLGLAIFASCQKEETNSPVTGDEKNVTTTSTTTTSPCCNCLVNASPTVTDEETSMLVFIREEEKLARDVYKVLYDLYHIPIFKNINKSEQHHMDMVLLLLQYYNIPDPASPDSGVFNNPELQQLYNDLTAQGNISLTEALKVGATIEDKDIFDLETDMTNTANPAILCTFDKLACASGHHIRAFSAHLTARGVTYVPEYISQEEYNSIMTLPAQNCAR
jgi:hypothetical protein